MTTPPRTDRTRAVRQKVPPWGFVGIGAMACVLFLDLWAAATAPWWMTVLLLLLWLVLAAMAVRWFVPHPRRVPWLALVGFLVWFPTILLGTSYLGWGE